VVALVGIREFLGGNSGEFCENVSSLTCYPLAKLNSLGMLIMGLLGQGQCIGDAQACSILSG